MSRLHRGRKRSTRLKGRILVAVGVPRIIYADRAVARGGRRGNAEELRRTGNLAAGRQGSQSTSIQDIVAATERAESPLTATPSVGPLQRTQVQRSCLAENA